MNIEMLLEESQKANAVVQLIPVVGDFVGKDEPLFALYGNVSELDENILASSIDFGVERTLDQDPTFAFRIILDIALKALSPAINDPTTAVLAIDQLHRLLRSVGKRNLRTDNITDESGKLRVIFRTPNWEDFVNLACTELRRYGADSIQVVRRLRAMIENLIRHLARRSSRRASGPARSARSRNQGYIQSSGGIGSRTGNGFTGPRRDTDLKKAAQCVGQQDLVLVVAGIQVFRRGCDGSGDIFRGWVNEVIVCGDDPGRCEPIRTPPSRRISSCERIGFKLNTFRPKSGS